MKVQLQNKSCTRYAVNIGDRWKDGVFTRDDSQVEYVPSPEENIAVLQAQMAEKDEIINALLGVEKDTTSEDTGAVEGTAESEE